jgi:hypothetical protein
MVSRAKKASLNLKPLTLPQTTACLGNRCRNIFLLYKQMWYVPFFWLLTWFSYWILREVLVLYTPLHQVNPVNYFGAIISIAVLLLAVPRFGTIIRKRSVLVGTQMGIKIKNAFFLVGVHIKSRRIGFSWKKKLVQNIKVKKMIQQKVQVKFQSPIKGSQAPGLEPPKQLKQPSLSLRTLSGNTNYSKQHQLPQEIPEECLTCANLISCDYRQNRFGDPETEAEKRVTCRFAAELSIDKAVAS